MKIKFERYPFTPILGWSSSRFDLFTQCKRHYFYNYYTKFIKDVPQPQMQRLKKLTSVPLEIGNVVHHVVEDLLRRFQKSASPINEGKFIQYGIDLCDKFFDSKEFLEIYYGYTQQIDRESAKERISISLKNLLRSPLLEWISTTAIHESNSWVIEPDGFGETRIAGLKAYCKMDFLLPVGEEVHILDWKSGKKQEEKHRAQLLGYALAASVNNPSIDRSKFIPRIIYMYPSLDELSFSITDEDLTAFAQTVQIQTESMYRFCSNVEQNIPKEFNLFEKTTFTALCSNCPYQEPCKNAG